MGIYVSRRIKYCFNRGIISVFQRQQAMFLTIINYLDLKSLPWKHLETRRRINMSSPKPRTELPGPMPLEDKQLYLPLNLRHILTVGRRIKIPNRRIGKTIKRPSRRNPTNSPPHRNRHLNYLPVHRLPVNLANPSPDRYLQDGIIDCGGGFITALDAGIEGIGKCAQGPYWGTCRCFEREFGGQRRVLEGDLDGCRGAGCWVDSL